MKLLRSPRTGRVVCRKCRQGYGSEFDGLCYKCRGGVSAWDAKHEMKFVK